LAIIVKVKWASVRVAGMGITIVDKYFTKRLRVKFMKQNTRLRGFLT